MGNWFKRNGIHFAIAGIFLAICFFYFTPAFQGKTLGQNDVTRAQSTQKEIMDYRAKDITILWTNQILGGMPAYQIWAPYASNITTHVITGLRTVFPTPIDTVMLFLLGAYLLFCVLKLNPWLAAAGAIAVTFSTYNFILLLAGHSNQAYAIAFFAPIVAAVIMTFRGRYFMGGALLALFLAMEIRANHIQMTYYLLIALLLLVGFELYNAYRNKTMPAFVKSIAYVGGAIVLALAVNASILWSTAEYSGDSYRGKSNLTSKTEPTNGLDKEYAFQWSEGVGETMTVLVPNLYGSSTGLGMLDENSELVKTLAAKGLPGDQIGGFMQQLPGVGISTYWGDKQFTEGPFYFGAIVCFLFVFGLLIVRNRIKWWLLAAIVLSILLSWGRNLSFLSDFFFHYFPLYNKFRAVESIMVIAALCFPIMAYLAVSEVITNTDKTYLFSKLKIALYIVGGITLLLIATPDTFFSFRTAQHQQIIDYLTQALKGDSGLASDIGKAIISDRISLARMDAIRTLIFVLLTFGLMWALIKQKLNVMICSIILLVLTLFDFWQVDKRYLKESSFVDKQEATAPQPREVDQFIQRDKDPDFRVIDLTQPLMQDAVTPYFYKSVGGYSAARLKRYDELVTNQFSKSLNQDVLDMLNVKYVINADPKTNNLAMQVNPNACGHAWFVKSVRYVANSDQEMQVISAFSPKDEAIVDKKYRSLIDEKQQSQDPNGSITLTSYNPDHMVYQSGTTATMVAVFSEVYYDKGWKMLIDGKEHPYFRADYLLRAAQIPVGNHKIEFVFHPASYYTGEGISLAGSILLVLALGGAAYTENRKKPVTGRTEDKR
ncbi:YfhO family protein [Mucilaginibacter ginkgonis]|uniref:YfhO family protein n=1 Tax=Mucilaginibacter ginkgonis TaxID=2682091 RepID=A0A6I4INT9_9SPHI|nr:YfhO family protein [Mucilaginibacter ginkgonis]QQL48827.1 YfhO family protein [Mucilaginibacter ginkgonis]